MRDEDVLRVIDKYADALGDKEPKRYPVREYRTDDDSCYANTQHVMYMISEMRKFAAEGGHTEKLMRWLGFVQGVLWEAGEWSLEELMEHNRGAHDGDEQ